MRTRDKICLAALAVAAASLLTSLVSPVITASPLQALGQGAAGGAGPSAEGILLSSSAEQRAVLDDRHKLRLLDERIEPLRERSARAEEKRKPDQRKVVLSEVERELARRWKEFERRLRDIRR